MDDGEDKQPPGYPAEMLYVVETIELTKNESSTSTESFKLILLPGNHKFINFHKIASLVPRPHPQEGKGLGTMKCFLGLALYHVIACVPIQISANNHMIAALAEPRIGANVPRPFPRVRGGVWERDYKIAY